MLIANTISGLCCCLLVHVFSGSTMKAEQHNHFCQHFKKSAVLLICGFEMLESRFTTVQRKNIQECSGVQELEMVLQ